MKYYKRYNNEFYDFDQAYDLFEKQNLKDVVMRVDNKFGNPSKVEVNWEMIINQKKSMAIPVWAVKSDKWSLSEPDFEKQHQVDEIGDWIEDDLDFELDSRFWEHEKMSISDWWAQLDSNILIEEDYFTIMNWLKESNRLNYWKERNSKYFREN